MRHFDAHAYRTEDEDGVWDFAAGCMRTYLILKDKAERFREDAEIQEALADAMVDQLALPTLPEAAGDALRDPARRDVRRRRARRPRLRPRAARPARDRAPPRRPAERRGEPGVSEAVTAERGLRPRRRVDHRRVGGAGRGLDPLGPHAGRRRLLRALQLPELPRAAAGAGPADGRPRLRRGSGRARAARARAPRGRRRAVAARSCGRRTTADPAIPVARGRGDAVPLAPAAPISSCASWCSRTSTTSTAVCREIARAARARRRRVHGDRAPGRVERVPGSRRRVPVRGPLPRRDAQRARAPSGSASSSRSTPRTARSSTTRVRSRRPGS